MRTSPFFPLLTSAILATTVAAAPNDWAEGTPGKDNGATRDYYNRAALLEWKKQLGDWRDAKNALQGSEPFARAAVTPDHKGKFVEWDVTSLVREWLSGKLPNQGMLLRIVEGGGKCAFGSREQKEESMRPQLVLTGGRASLAVTPQADTYLDRSTYRSMGRLDTIKVSSDSQHLLIRFDLRGSDIAGKLDRAILRLHCIAPPGNAAAIGVFRCAPGHDVPAEEPTPGLAAQYPGDKGIAQDPAVTFFTDFESEKWTEEWTQAAPLKALTTLDADPDRKFLPFQGKALRVRIAKGETTGLNLTWQFRKKIDVEPEEIFFRYCLRLGDDWNQTVQGGKFPGISGTYGKSGWGGRRSDGTEGWSARGSFMLSIPDDNPLAGLHPIGTYCYHADMPGNYGDIWPWSRGYRGFLEKNRWYSIEQHLKMNTPGQKDGILRAWVDGRLAFEKTDIRFRQVDKLRIEQIWMNVYHGGTIPSPYDQHLFIDNVVIARQYIGPMK